jgi:rod shape-determining protein MreD
LKPLLALLLFGLLALMVQGAANMALSARYVPDLGLLVVVAVAVHVRSAAGGLLLAAVLGYATDLLSGSLLGQQMLLRMLGFAAVRFSRARLNLRGPLPLALFTAALTLVLALSLRALSAFFDPDLGGPHVSPAKVLPHALVNGLAVPFVTAWVGALLARFGDDDAAQRPLRIETRSVGR